MANFEQIAEDVASDLVPDATDVVAKKLAKVAEHPLTVEVTTQALHLVDKTAPMRAMRYAWDKFPKIMQWGLLHSPSPVASAPLKSFVKLGLITYKGHLDEDGQVMDQKIQAMGGFQKLAVKYGVKFGKYAFPELAAVEPFIDPLMKLDKIQEDMSTQVRKRLRDLRQEVDQNKKAKATPRLTPKTAHRHHDAEPQQRKAA